MKSSWLTAAKALTGLFVFAAYAMPQAYTISAKPGVVNYIEGDVFVNGRQVSTRNLKATFLNADDTISTDIGKAEVLLTPGVFLRIGDNSRVHMISPSLVNTQIDLKAGEAMIEADDIVKDSQVTVADNGGSAVIDKNGLYKFTAGDRATAAVLEGKLDVFNGDRKSEIGKGHELLIGQAAKTQKFDPKKEDDLYAWSNVRAQYNAASSYQAAKDVNTASYGGVWGDYGFGGFANPGWMWNSGFNSYAWLPGGGAFYSPFGYGFYSPGLVGYAPVIYAPMYGGYGYNGYGNGYYQNGQAAGGGVAGQSAAAKPVTAAVPVNPAHPPATGMVASSPFAHSMASGRTLQTYSSSGFRTASGMVVPAGRSFSGSSGGGHSLAAGGISTGGGSYGGGRSGGFSGASSGHASGGASGGGGAHGGASGGGGGHR